MPIVSKDIINTIPSLTYSYLNGFEIGTFRKCELLTSNAISFNVLPSNFAYWVDRSSNHLYFLRNANKNLGFSNIEAIECPLPFHTTKKEETMRQACSTELYADDIHMIEDEVAKKEVHSDGKK